MPLESRTQTDDGATEANRSRDDVYLLYHELTCVTGERLGLYLGVDHGTECDASDYDLVIRWGSRRRMSNRHSAEEVVNEKGAIRNASSKFNALEQLAENDVQVPPHTRYAGEVGRDGDGDTTLDYPVLGRNDSHSQGSDIELILQRGDLDRTSCDHYVQYIPTAAEFRVHVLDGEVVKVHEKRPRNVEPGENHAYVRNYETGWVFLHPQSSPPDEQLAIDAVEALDLDFGAVDMIRAEGTGEEYVLEVNTAPSLDEPNLHRYGEAIAEYAGFGADNVAGMDAVDGSEIYRVYDDDEEGNDA